MIFFNGFLPVDASVPADLYRLCEDTGCSLECYIAIIDPPLKKVLSHIHPFGGVLDKDNAIRTNHIKARIDKTQQNSKCRLCGDRRNDQSHNKRMQQISTEAVQGELRLGRQGDPLGNVQEISIRPYKQMVYAQPGACPRK